VSVGDRVEVTLDRGKLSADVVKTQPEDTPASS
jgi:hypothetical protein